jgi:hypothetical protein
MDEFEKAEEILDSIDAVMNNPSTELETRYLRGLLQISREDPDRESLEGAVTQFRTVIDFSDEHSEVDIAMYYSGLASTLQKLGRDEDMIAALREGSEKLTKELQRVRPYSIRNSIMTRREIAEFINICRNNGLPFPPDGFVFSTDR